MNDDNRGAIWRNEKKERDTQPDFTGQATIDGVAYWVSAWKRRPDAKPNSPALSFSVKPKEDRQSKPAPPAQDDLDDSIPF